MIRDEILKGLQRATGTKDIQLEFPENEEFGDYATNVALKVQSSREMAEEIVEKLKKDKDLAKVVERIEVAGGGFINFWLSRDALVGQLEAVISQKDTYGSSNLGKGKTAVFDYSSPNIAKRFSIGHLRSTVIGQALYNLYKFLGYKVIGDNHMGDWGTQFGTLLYQINHQQLTVNKLTIDKLEELYVDFNKKAEENPKLWDEARASFKKLEEGDQETKRIWQEIVDISMAEFERIYRILDIKIDFAYGESFYEDKMPEVIELLRKKNISKKSQGAEITEFPPPAGGLPPAMIVKSDGTTTYLTRDLATIKFRLDEWNPDIIIYEVGSDQILHFRQLFAIAGMLSWAKGREFVHVAHGLIRFPHGKMSTRRGQTIKLEEVLNEAVERARKIKDDENIATAVGIGAVKYFDLMHHPATDIVFDWEKMFVLEGNSAPYLQYTVARTNSVLAKVKSQKLKVKSFNNEEIAVLRALSRFPEVVGSAAKNNSPNLLCEYLFDLAQKYNNFYNTHRIIGSENLELRLGLTSATGQVLKNGLMLLGIEAPERM